MEDQKSKDQKRQEILEKGADMMSNAAKKVDSLVDKRSALGEYSSAVVLGVIAMVIYALVYYPGILIIGAIGAAAGLAPKILRMSLAKQAELRAKKENKIVITETVIVPKEEKTEEKK